MTKRLIYYDTETTGVNPQNDRIVEIAAFDPLLNRTFQTLVHPKIPIPKEAASIHGISDEMVKEAPPFAEVGLLFAEFCGQDAVLVAHNNDSFDYLFLTQEFKRNDLILPSWEKIDSLKWARKYRPDLPRHALQFLRQIYGIEANNAHRALDDVIVLHKIFSIMIDDLSVDTILNLLKGASTELPEVMPFGKYAGKPLKEIPSDYIAWLKGMGALDKPENARLKVAFEKLVTK